MLTEWDEFKHLDFARIRQSLRYPIVVDGHNLLSPEEMHKLKFNYLSMGRPDVIPGELSHHGSAEAVA